MYMDTHTHTHTHTHTVGRKPPALASLHFIDGQSMSARASRSWELRPPPPRPGCHPFLDFHAASRNA